MIDKEKILDTVTERLENLPVGHYLDLRTYKHNRSVIIVKQSKNNLLIIEDGFFREKFYINSTSMEYMFLQGQSLLCFEVEAAILNKKII